MGKSDMNQRSKINSYLQNARDSFEGKPWYGTSVMNILDQVQYEVVNTVPGGFQKSIVTLLRHMLSWKEFVIKKLGGQADYKIPDDSITNWDFTQLESETEWLALKMDLHKKHEEFLRLLDTLTDKDLEDQVGGSIYSKEYLITGAIQHDIFHLGQIALMMRALNKTSSSSS